MMCEYYTVTMNIHHVKADSIHFYLYLITGSNSFQSSFQLILFKIPSLMTIVTTTTFPTINYKHSKEFQMIWI